MNDEELQQRAVDLCASPVGCVFLLKAEAGMLPPEAVAEPVVAVQIAAQALSLTFPFRGDHEWVVATALEQGPRLLPFARDILAQPAVEWWFAPLDREAQEWIGPTNARPPAAVGVDVPESPPSSWERYAQKPASGIYTSTGVGRKTEALADWRRPVPWSAGDAIPAGFDEVSSALAALIYGGGDYEEGPLPLVRYRVQVAPDLRVFEVDGPRAWQDLCARYPAQYEHGQIVPDWGAFADEWDAVHLTLGGLLTADQVRVESAAGWSMLGGWEFEGTRWLRWRLAAIERMPDLTGFQDAPLALPRSALLWPPPVESEHFRLIHPSHAQPD